MFSCHLEGHWRKYQDPEPDTESDPDNPNPDPLVRGADPDPHQNVTDPQYRWDYLCSPWSGGGSAGCPAAGALRGAEYSHAGAGEEGQGRGGGGELTPQLNQSQRHTFRSVSSNVWAGLKLSNTTFFFFMRQHATSTVPLPYLPVTVNS